MTSLADAYAQAVAASPGLASSPDLIGAAAQSADPAQTAQVLSQTTDATALGQAVQHHQTHHAGVLQGLFDGATSALSDAKNAITSSLEYLGKPLQGIQHDYRYLHDLWAKSDPVTATLATLGVVGGGIGGALVGGLPGAALGADAVAGLEGAGADSGLFGSNQQQLYRQSQNEQISPGRDLAHLLQLHDTNHGLGKLISGTGDLAFDFTFDPVNHGLGTLAKGRTSALGLADSYAARRLPAFQKFLLDHGYGGLGIQDSAGIDTLDRLAAARNNPQYNRAIGMIANSVRNGGAGGVLSDFPTLSRLAPFLANADTADKVHEVLLAQANSAQIAHGYNMLPSRTLLRSVTAPVVTKLKTAGGSSSGEAVEGGVLAALNPRSDVTLTGALSQKVRTFSGYLPYTIDRTAKDGKELLDLSNTRFDLMDPGSLAGMYRSLRFSMSDVAARTAMHDIAVAQAAGDVTQVRTAWLGAHKQMLVAAGLSDNHPLVQQVMNHLSGAHVDNPRAYGYGATTGSDAGMIEMKVPARPTDAVDAPDVTTVKVPAALWDYQGSQMSAFPNFWQVKNAVRAMNTLTNALGSADEFISGAYTNSIFKPLALVNAGFGLRVAMAEALPAAFRYGALNMLQNRIAASTAEHQYKLDNAGQRWLEKANKARESGDMEGFTKYTQKAQEQEVGHVTAAVAHLLGGAVKALKVDDETLHIANRIVQDGNGQVVWGVGRAGESAHREAVGAVDRQNTRLWYAGNTRKGVRATGNFTFFDPNSSQYSDLWQTQLNHLAQDESAPRIAQNLRDFLKQGDDLDTAAQKATVREANRIRGLSGLGNPMDTPYYQRGRSTLIRFKEQTPEDFAAARVDAVRNVLSSKDGFFHDDLAKNLADGVHTEQAQLDKIDPSLAPKMLPGEEVVPVPAAGIYAEVINRGFKAVVDPIINHLSREPLFLAAVKEQIPALKSLVNRGIISEDDMYRDAYYRATEAMLPQIHNVQLRSQFSALSRNLLPFYFAQEQAIKRTAFLATKDPGALRQYQQVAHGLSDPNFVHTNDQGQRSLVIPLAGGIGSSILDGLGSIGAPYQAGLPLTFTGSTESLKTVLPEITAPGTSPLVTVPLNALASHFPEWSPEVKAIVGDRGFGQSGVASFIPNQLIKNVVIGRSADVNNKQFANAMTSALAAAAYHHQLPGPDATPSQRQAFLDRIKNNARSIFYMKAIVASFSPLSPQAIPEDFGLRDEFYKLTQKKGMTYPQALQTFLAQHGSDAVSYTIAKSSNETGALVPSTQAALDFIQGNGDLIRNHLSAAYFVPEIADKSGDAQVIHNELVNMGLREKYTPDNFLNEMYIKAGNQTYYNDKKVHEAALATYTSPDDIAAENKNWSDHVQQLKAANVIWAADFTSEDRTLRAHQLYSDMLDLFRTGDAPTSEQGKAIYALAQDYQMHAAALASIPSGTHGVTVEKDNWTTYLNKQVTDHPELSNVINNVFARLDRRL